ncbi:MAG: methyltransferase domain-containing protein [Gemmataceae bacterium]|nr:methyltransferase domain-containing protein [Gemmataceae bacterium]
MKKSPVSLRPPVPPESLKGRVRFPLVVVLGTPAEVTNLLVHEPKGETVCYQMDLHQADRLGQSLREAGVEAKVTCLPDLWDLPGGFQTAVFFPSRGGERDLQIDMVEQGFQLLPAGGQFLVWSSLANDLYFPGLLKKVFKKSHTHLEGETTLLWSQKNSEHPRRRHEVNIRCKVNRGEPAHFLSRPGTFSYGQFDQGSRALCEAMSLRAGQKVIDLGCGWGGAGVFAWKKVGPSGHITFVDSNVRAVELARFNAEANGVANFAAVARGNLEGFLPRSFDIALAKPPYFANHALARLFIERARELIKADGSFFLVTQQSIEMVEIMSEVGFDVEGAETRGHTVLMHRGLAARQDMQVAQ